MNTSFFLASKYYFSNSRKSFVNRISLLGIIIIALMIVSEIVVLSVFNGFTDQLKSIHQSFDSDIEIAPKKGKILTLSRKQIEEISKIQGVTCVTKILQDDAILDYEGKQDVVTFKGVENNYFKQNEMIQKLEVGHGNINDSSEVRGLIGVGLEYKFSINLKNDRRLLLLYPNRNKKFISKSQSSYQSILVKPIGVFRIGIEYDEKYIILPLTYAQELAGYPNEFSSIEIKLKNLNESSQVKENILQLIGGQYDISNREERHSSIYKAIKVEKMITYLIFGFILIIASLNLYAAVSMLVLSKQKDIFTLNSMGLSKENIKKIFLIEGLMLIFTGVFVGVVLAGTIIFLQTEIGLVSVPQPNEQQQFLPVRLSVDDLIFSVLLTIFVCLIMILRPVLKGTENS